MKPRALTIVGVLALGLLPALAGAQGPTAPLPGTGTAPLFAPADPVINVKAPASVYGVMTDEAGRTKVKLIVQEGAIEWPGENIDARADATGLFGKYVYTYVTPETEVFVADRPADLAALKPGVTGKFQLRTNCTPVTEGCMYELRSAFVAGVAPVKPPTPPKPEGDKAPVHGFELGFFPRLWTVRGDVLGLEQEAEKVVVNVDVRRLVNQAKRFNDEGRRLARLDAYVVIGPKAVVTDERGQRIAAKELQVDDSVKVVGKFLKPDKWIVDEADDKVPTLLAKRVRVIDRD